MQSIMSKRQQARNERALLDLIDSVPGNQVCADCQLARPNWASYTLGVFLCQRCASIHRRLGTHVSRVKSLTMDTWTADQVQTMRDRGNARANQQYNPLNRRVGDVENESELAWHIQQKYTAMNRDKFAGTSSTSSHPGSPPPPPPKNGADYRTTSPSAHAKNRGKTIGASSSALEDAALGGVASSTSSTTSNGGGPRPTSPIRQHKAARIFGITIDPDLGDTDQKMKELRNNGFYNDTQNHMILNKFNGDVNLSVDFLLRHGDQCQPSPIEERAAKNSGNYISDNNNNNNGNNATLPPPPLTSQPTGTNPFLYTVPPAPIANPGHDVALAFQNLSLSTQRGGGMASSPLFPHHTGGGLVAHHTGQGTVYAPLPQHHPHLSPAQAFQSLPSTPGDGSTSLAMHTLGSNPFFVPQHTGLSQVSTASAPATSSYLPGTPPQAPPSQILHQGQGPAPPMVVASTAPLAAANNPFLRTNVSAGLALPSPLSQIPEQNASPAFYPSQPPSLPTPAYNPFWQQPVPNTVPGQSTQTQDLQNPWSQQQPWLQQQQKQQQQFQQIQFQQLPQPQQQQQYPTGYAAPRRLDKASIMALYANSTPTNMSTPVNIPKSNSVPVSSNPVDTSHDTVPVNQATFPATSPVANQTGTSQSLATISEPHAAHGAGAGPTLGPGGAGGGGAGIRAGHSLGTGDSPTTHTSHHNVSTAHIGHTINTATSNAGKSRDSMAFTLNRAWANGRHSPDAFASLSSQHLVTEP